MILFASYMRLSLCHSDKYRSASVRLFPLVFVSVRFRLLFAFVESSFGLSMFVLVQYSIRFCISENINPSPKRQNKSGGNRGQRVCLDTASGQHPYHR